jgi:protein SCO1
MTAPPLLLGLATLALAGVITGSIVGLPSHISRTPASDGPPNRIERIRQANLPNVPLITHTGQFVRFYDDLIKGQIVAINFMFTTCDNACPVTTTHIAHVQQALRERHGDKVRFLSISLSPEFDTPEVLRAYANTNAAGPNWTFLTGQRTDIEQLRRALGAYERDLALDSDPTQHTGVLIMGNEPIGRWKSIAALANPVRIRQAVERVMLPVEHWPTGSAMIDEVAYDDRAARR